MWSLDETKTAMGGRSLKQWIDRPLIRVNQIEERQEMVETLISHFFEREDLRERLKEVYDLERLAGRVAFWKCQCTGFNSAEGIVKASAWYQTAGCFTGS